MNVFQENALWMEEIFKDHVKKEKFAQKNWKKEHGYIMDEIHEVLASSSDHIKRILDGRKAEED